MNGPEQAFAAQPPAQPEPVQETEEITPPPQALRAEEIPAAAAVPASVEEPLHVPAEQQTTAEELTNTVNAMPLPEQQQTMPHLTLEGPAYTGTAQSQNTYQASPFEEAMPPVPPAPEPPSSPETRGQGREHILPEAPPVTEGTLERTLRVLGILGAVLFGWFALCCLRAFIVNAVYGTAIYASVSLLIDAFLSLLTAAAWALTAFISFLHSKPHSENERAALFAGAAVGAGMGLSITVIRSVLHAVQLLYSMAGISPTWVTAGAACVFGIGGLYGAMYILQAEPFRDTTIGDALRDLPRVIPAVLRGSTADSPAPKRPRPQAQPVYTMSGPVPPLAPQTRPDTAARQTAYTAAGTPVTPVQQPPVITPPPIRPPQPPVAPPPVQPQQPSAPKPPVQQNAGTYPGTAAVQPVKTDRSLLVYILLNLVTCGIYGFVFYYKWAQDVNTVCSGDGKNTPGLVQYFLLTLLTCGIYGLVWHYGVANRLAENASRYGLSFSENGTTYLMWFLIGILLCGIGPLVGLYFMFRNTNALCAAYNQRLNSVG